MHDSSPRMSTTWRDHFCPPPTPTCIVQVTFTDQEMEVRLNGGRRLAVPLSWFPMLQKASQSDRIQYEILGGGLSLHWESLDEDLSLEGLLRIYD